MSHPLPGLFVRKDVTKIIIFLIIPTLNTLYYNNFVFALSVNSKFCGAKVSGMTKEDGKQLLRHE